jgi:hypothetical protein
MPINRGKAHDALQEAVAACGGKWRDIEFHGSIPEHDQMETPKGRMVLFARAQVFAYQAGIDTSNINGTRDDKARALADRIEDQCVAELGISAWTGKPPAKKRAPAARDLGPQDTVVVTRKNRKVGVEISLVLMANEDPSCRWQTECAHGSCVGHATRKVGESFMSVPWDWCEECRRLAVAAGCAK